MDRRYEPGETLYRIGDACDVKVCPYPCDHCPQGYPDAKHAVWPFTVEKTVIGMDGVSYVACDGTVVNECDAPSVLFETEAAAAASAAKRGFALASNYDCAEGYVDVSIGADAPVDETVELPAENQDTAPRKRVVSGAFGKVAVLCTAVCIAVGVAVCAALPGGSADAKLAVEAETVAQPVADEVSDTSDKTSDNTSTSDDDHVNHISLATIGLDWPQMADKFATVSAEVQKAVQRHVYDLECRSHAKRSQYEVDCGGIVEWEDGWYASHVYDEGGIFHEFQVGDIVNIDGMAVVIEGWEYFNYWHDTVEDVRATCGWDAILFQTCMGLDDSGEVVIYYGHPK